MGKQVTVLAKFDPKENHLFDVVKEVEKVYVPIEEGVSKGNKDTNKKTETVEKENVPVETQEEKKVALEEPMEKKKGPGQPRSKAQSVTTYSKVTKKPEKEPKSFKDIEAKRQTRMTTSAQKRAKDAEKPKT
ncbi:unnamed protein product [Caenorhabditis brenneri]